LSSKLETSLYGVAHTYLDIMNHLSVNHQCDRRTDRRTELR